MRFVYRCGACGGRIIFPGPMGNIRNEPGNAVRPETPDGPCRPSCGPSNGDGGYDVQVWESARPDPAAFNSRGLPR